MKTSNTGPLKRGKRKTDIPVDKIGQKPAPKLDQRTVGQKLTILLQAMGSATFSGLTLHIEHTIEGVEAHIHSHRVRVVGPKEPITDERLIAALRKLRDMEIAELKKAVESTEGRLKLAQERLDRAKA